MRFRPILQLALCSAGACAAAVAQPDASPDLLEQVRMLRLENDHLRSRLDAIEAKLGQVSSSTKAVDAHVAPQTEESNGTHARQSGAQAFSENPSKLFVPFGSFGLRYGGFFTQSNPKGYAAFANRPEVFGRLGAFGQVTSRLSYRVRLSTGIDNTGADPWISFADPGTRRNVAFDEYNIAYLLNRRERFTQTIVAGKLANLPQALGTTQLILDEDVGLPVFADILNYRASASTSLTFIGAAGFITNSSSDLLNPKERRLNPLVTGGTITGGTITDLTQDGTSRANVYIGELALDRKMTESSALRASLGFFNVAHASDSPLFIGATGLYGIDGLRVPNFPQGISSNLPANLPVRADGIVPITGTDLETAEISSRYASAYRLLNIFGSYTIREHNRLPVRVSADWVRNLGAGSNVPVSSVGVSVRRLAQKRRDGIVAAIDAGPLDKIGAPRFGYKFLLIESDATIDYINNDQWHTNIRGHELDIRWPLSKFATPFASVVIARNADGRLIGFSSLAGYPVSDGRPGNNPWTFRPRVGVLFGF